MYPLLGVTKSGWNNANFNCSEELGVLDWGKPQSYWNFLYLTAVCCQNMVVGEYGLVGRTEAEAGVTPNTEDRENIMIMKVMNIWMNALLTCNHLGRQDCK